MANPYSRPGDAADYLHDDDREHADWYAGITSDPEARLFDEHAVDQEGSWAYAECLNDDVARGAEQLLLELGYQGGPGGGNESSVFVYVYETTVDTCEDC